MKSEFKLQILRKAPTFSRAAQEIGLSLAAMSSLYHGREPSRSEELKLVSYLGFNVYRKIFGTPKYYVAKPMPQQRQREEVA